MINNNKLTTLAFFSILSVAKLGLADTEINPHFLIPGITSYARWSEQPILLSTGPNQPWTFSAINMPYSKNTDLLSLSCAGSACVSVGFYEPYANVTFQQPIIISRDQNNHWVYIKHIKHLPIINFGAFTSITCNEQQCLTTGYYDNTNDHQTPILIVAGNGQSWHVVDNLSLPPNIVNANLFSITCLDAKNCFAAGNYITNRSEQLPLIYASGDSGVSWSVSKLTDFPHNTSASLLSSACNNATCFSAGFYSTKLASNLPVLLTSNTQGATWQQVVRLSYPSGMQTGALNHVQCMQNMCIAFGSYTNANNEYKPLIEISEDKGKTWLVPTDQSMVGRPSYLELKSAACDTDHCTIVGSYNPAASTQTPLILNLNLVNHQWLLTHNKTYEFRTEDEVLNAVSCKGMVCVAAGDSSQYPSYQSPLVLESQDAGLTWARVDDFVNMDPGSYTRFKTIAAR